MTNGFTQKVLRWAMATAVVFGVGAAPAVTFAALGSNNICTSSSDTKANCVCPTKGNGFNCTAPGTFLRWNDGSCVADPRPAAPAQGCSANKVFNCNSMSCGCSSGQQECLVAADADFGSCFTPPSCATTLPGSTYNPCTQQCETPNVLLAAPSAQTGAINITGSIASSAGNLRLDSATAAGAGDIFMASGKAIRADAVGLTTINVGNYAVGATGVNVNFSGPQTGVGSTGSLALYNTADQTTNYERAVMRWASNALTIGMERGGTGVVRNMSVTNGGAGMQFTTNSTVTFLGSAGNQYIMYPQTDVGIYLAGNITNRTNKPVIQLSNVSGASFNAAAGTQTLLQVDSVIRQTGTAAFDAVVVNPDFAATTASGQQTLIRAKDTNVDRFIVNRQGDVRIGSRSGTVAGYPLDVAETTGSAITRLADDSVAGNLWTGLRLDRGYGTERWFFGMNGTDSDLILTRGGTATEIMNINTTTGAVNVNGTTFTTGGAVNFSGPVTYASGGAECTLPKYVGMTVTSYDGNDAAPNKYTGMNNACNAAGGALAGSHICTPDEIMRTLNCSAASLPASGSAWVANGPPGYNFPAANDCSGWSTAGGTDWGTVWTFSGTTGGTGYASSCNLSFQVACCK